MFGLVITIEMVVVLLGMFPEDYFKRVGTFCVEEN